MYWCKARSISWYLAAVLLLTGLQACKPDSNNNSGAGLKFFDLKGYISADIAKLKKVNPAVTKTVTYNDKAETKTLHIKDWEKELALFAESDINKPAWKQSYSITSTADFLIYTSNDPALKTYKIIIKKAGSTVKWILIMNHIKNVLYETDEKLTYFPDSLYQIHKKQRVRLIGTNTYRIDGHLQL